MGLEGVWDPKGFGTRRGLGRIRLVSKGFGWYTPREAAEGATGGGFHREAARRSRELRDKFCEQFAKTIETRRSKLRAEEEKLKEASRAWKSRSIKV